MTKRLDISLFGACIVRSTGQPAYEITGAKHKAVFALLATAPFGRRTRSYLQDILWGRSSFDTGRQSLRRALSDIKALMGDDFERLLTVNNTEISLDLGQVHFIGRPGGGTFLEGLEIRDREFEDWLTGIRQSPDQLFALFSANGQPAPPSILPVIAVLPFRVVMGEPRHGVLGDWLAEEMCRSLSRSGLLSVISHLSAREMAAARIDLAQVRETLGVDYCVAGSLRLVGDRAILDADCIEAETGRILWTRQIDGTVADFLTPGSPPVTEVVRSIGQTIASEAVTHVQGRADADLQDHRLLIAGVGLMHQLRLTGFARSRALIEEAIRRAPRAPEPHAWLGEWYVMSVFNGWSTDRAKDTATAAASTARALDIDPENSFALTIDGVVANSLLLRMDVAEARFNAALDRNPNESMAWLVSGVMHAFRDDGAEAVARCDRAMRLSPMDPFGYFYDALTSTAYLAAENYEQALVFADRSLAKNDRHLSPLRTKISSLHHLDRAEEAREAGRLHMLRQPGFALSDYQNSHPAAHYKLGRAVMTALSAVGIS